MPARLRQLIVAMISLALAFALGVPALALADETQVEAENLAAVSGQATVSGIVIDDVEGPVAGAPLDGRAQVSTAEQASWEIPVLWITDDLQLAGEGASAQQGANYLPVLAFYVPEGHSLESSSFTVTLSASLTELFQGAPIVSVYESSTGITYILPATVRDYFAHADRGDAPASMPAKASGDGAVGGAKATEPAAAEPEAPEPEAARPEQAEAEEPGDPERPEEPDQPQAKTLVEIYCAQTARDAFSDSDLEFLINLVLNRLQPQAVELLLDKFPAFRAAADQGKISSRIGLYIYCKEGDADGIPAHQQAPKNVLAFVDGRVVGTTDDARFCYLIGIDVSSLARKDASNIPIWDDLGRYVLARTGDEMLTFENTLVHELFHAIMNDFNRTGMIGATRASDAITDAEGRFPSKELAGRYNQTVFPDWFVEGTASAVENVFAYRFGSFEKLFEENSQTTAQGQLLYNYLNATNGSKEMLFDLGFSTGRDADGNEIDKTNACYVSGYLACLYLGELAARADSSIGTSVMVEDGTTTVSSEKIRLGLNAIFEELHRGATLDQIVRRISPTAADGGKLYASTADFERKFIKGAKRTDEAGDIWYLGDYSKGASTEFVVAVLGYLFDLDQASGGKQRPTGSILFAFDSKPASPLDASKTVESAYLKIIESNELVESSVPNAVALAGGGKSRSGTPSIVSVSTSASAGQAPSAAAAKAAKAASEAGSGNEPGGANASGGMEASAEQEAHTEGASSAASAQGSAERSCPDDDVTPHEDAQGSLAQEGASTGLDDLGAAPVPSADSTASSPEGTPAPSDDPSNAPAPSALENASNPNAPRNPSEE